MELIAEEVVARALEGTRDVMSAIVRDAMHITSSLRVGPAKKRRKMLCPDDCKGYTGSDIVGHVIGAHGKRKWHACVGGFCVATDSALWQLLQ